MAEVVTSMSHEKYSRIARVLHWMMAFPMIALLLFGEHTMGSHNARFLPSLHASAGVSIFLLVILRLFWRWRRRPPPQSNGSRLEIIAARLAHMALYAAMLLIPLSGWLAYTEHVRRSMGTRPASWFGLRIPLLPDFGINWHMIHNWGGKLVLALIILHAAAALKHHFYDKDDTMRRMLP
jgi:cytochrome b561